MEQERLKQAFKIKDQPVQEPEEEPQTLANDPRLQMAREYLSNRKDASIEDLLSEIADDIDSGNTGAAQGKIKRAEKIVQSSNVSRQEQLILNRLKDMVK